MWVWSEMVCHWFVSVIRESAVVSNFIDESGVCYMRVTVSVWSEDEVVPDESDVCPGR